MPEDYAQLSACVSHVLAGNGRLYHCYTYCYQQSHNAQAESRVRHSGMLIELVGTFAK